jgi:3-methylfumaryl-CoA hydratase
MSKDQDDLSAWVGKQQSVSTHLSDVPARQMAALMDDAPRVAATDMGALPHGWHWLYFNPIEVQSRLGPDGHPLRGDFLPPVALERRMWAGSRLNWRKPLNVGTTVEKHSEILRVARKEGRSGPMVFVTLAHRYEDAQGDVLLNEEHDIVYRDAPGAAEAAGMAAIGERIRAGEHVFERQGEWQSAVQADAVMLFRYSAATFNGHRIHYDADFCRNVEGYPGLVVHGPLIATLLLHFIQTRVAPGRWIASFQFKALKPTFDLSGFHLHAASKSENALDVWSTNNLGEVALEGSMTLA